MTMLEIHQAAIQETTPIFHEFIARYNKFKKTVYGFVEGKDDPSFYRGFIEQSIPHDWSVELWAAGNKDKVIQLISHFDWDRFPKKRVAFFIDRDLSCFIGERLPTEDNVYITDKYSIENDVVSRSTCERILTEICNLSELTPSEKDGLLDLFENQVDAFFDALAPIMSWIILWKRNGKRPSLNDICMKHMFSFERGRLQPNPNPKNTGSPINYIHSQCNIDLDASIDITDIEIEFKRNDGHKLFCRGKYLLWFVVEFALSVHRDVADMILSISHSPKMRVSLSQSNGVLLIAPRARIPMSLKTFIDNTFCNYIMESCGTA